jgi:hypothetical protein
MKWPSRNFKVLYDFKAQKSHKKNCVIETLLTALCKLFAHNATYVTSTLKDVNVTLSTVN